MRENVRAEFGEICGAYICGIYAARVSAYFRHNYATSSDGEL